MRELSFLVIALLSGCSLAPGMVLDESRIAHVNSDIHQATSEQSDPVSTQIKPVLVSINASLIASENKQRIQNREQFLKVADPPENTEYRYLVGPGDVLSITVWGHAELVSPAGDGHGSTVGYVVRQDGTIFFPYAGVIKASGRTVSDIRNDLNQKLRPYVNNPQIDVRVAEFRSQKVFINGEVENAGVHPITDIPMTLIDCVSEAKVNMGAADLHHVTVTRNGKVYKVDLQSLYDGKNLSQNWIMQNGDEIHIPDRSNNKVFVMGEFKEPSVRMIDNSGMSLAEAISDKGGPDPVSADVSRIYVIRGGFDHPTIYKLDAHSADAMLLATSFQLQPADVVYAASTDISRWDRVISQILPSVQTLWMTKALIQ